MADQFSRLAQTVLAMQWQGGEDAMRTVETFTQPSVVRYQPDGNLHVSTQDGTLFVQPRDWITEDSQGRFAVLSDAEFMATYAPMTSSIA